MRQNSSLGQHKAREDPSKASDAVVTRCRALAALVSEAAEIPKSSITAQHPKPGCNVAESGLATDQGMEATAGMPKSIPQARASHRPQQVQPPRAAGGVSPGWRNRPRDPSGIKNTHSQRPRVSGALLAAGKELRPWVSSHDMLQFLSQGHLPDLAFPPQKKSHISSGSHVWYLCLKYASSQHSEDTNGMQILVESLRGPHSPTYKALNKMQ